MIRNFVALTTVCGVNAPGSNEPEPHFWENAQATREASRSRRRQLAQRQLPD